MTRMDSFLQIMANRKAQKALLVSNSPARLLIDGHIIEGGLMALEVLSGMVGDVIPDEKTIAYLDSNPVDFIHHHTQGTFVISAHWTPIRLSVEITPEILQGLDTATSTPFGMPSTRLELSHGLQQTKPARENAHGTECRINGSRLKKMSLPSWEADSINAELSDPDHEVTIHIRNDKSVVVIERIYLPGEEQIRCFYVPKCRIEMLLNPMPPEEAHEYTFMFGSDLQG